MLTLLPTKTKAGSLNLEFLRALTERLPLAAFVETGTFQGDSAATASALFPVVHTIELSETLAAKARERFVETPSVHVHQGDSAEVLGRVLGELAGPALFWLDGHYSEGMTAFGGQNTPIREELETIARGAPEGSVILVDDLRLFDPSANRPNLPPSMHGYPALTEIYALFAQMGYQFFVLGDVGLAVSTKLEFPVSSTIQALTISRLFDGENLEIGEVLEAEKVLQQAEGAERDTLLEMPKAHVAAEKLGVALHYRFWRALALLGQGKPVDAGKELVSVAERGFGHWRVRWYVASILAAGGEAETARALLDEVLQAAPDFAAARALRAELVGKAAAGGDRSAADDLDELKKRGLWREGEPLRLHLGCGEQRFKGYVNVDYPATQHNVMQVRPDYEANITQLQFPPESVDEIRLHHVFEHFNRVTALAMLIKWQQWLKVGGKLHIETPDLQGSAEMLVSDAPWKFKMGAVRHLAGDQAAAWAYHVDHWFPERYRHTLKALGFGEVETKSTRWEREPHLSNVHAFGVKTQVMTREQLIEAADALLWESTLASVEKPTYEVWRRQLRAVLANGESVGPANIHTDAPAAAPEPKRAPARPPQARATTALPKSELPLAEIHDFNQRERDRWMRAKAATVPAGQRVLDVGAGTCLYRPLFAHCDYKTHDFKQYTGVKHGGTKEYGHIDYVSDILAIPVPDHSFDVILCTEVLEHVPEPIKVLREIARILKPGGRAFISAPLGSGLHQLPFHFYGGYTPEWYKRFSKEAGLDAIEITPNGGFFKHLAQECVRAASLYGQRPDLHGPDGPELMKLLREGLPRLFFALDEKIFDERFTVGYFVEAVKTGVQRRGGRTSSAREAQTEAARRSVRSIDTLAPVDVTRNEASAQPVVVAKLMGGLGNQMFQYAAGLALARRTGATLKLDLSFLLDRTPRKNFTYRNYDLDLFALPKDCVVAKTVEAAARAELATFAEKRFGFDASFESLGANTYLEGYWQSPCYFAAVADELRATFASFRLPLAPAEAALAAEIRGCASVCLNVRRGDFVANPKTNAFHGVCSEVYFRDAVRHVHSRVPDAHFYIFSDDVEWCRSANLTDGAPCTFVSHAFAGERFSSYLQLMIACRHFIIPNSTFAWWAAYLGAATESIVVAPAPWFNDLSIETTDLFPASWTLMSRQPGPRPTDLAAAPKVSVIVPCYKQAHYLQECVESVVSQTFADWEVIIVNDGSPDNTSDVARGIIARHGDRRIRLIEKPNGGLSDARNVGIREARGSYILPLDADDRVHPEMLAKTVAVLDADPSVAIAYTDLVHFGAVTKAVRAAEYDAQILPRRNQLNACSLFRRTAWEAVGGYNRNMTWGYEDWDFWVGCREKGFLGKRVPELLLYYRVKDSSMYTKALEHHRELHAQIILNHPSLYTLATREKAERIVAEARAPRTKPARAQRSPLVSVVIPCYNQARYLASAVESVIAQSYTNWEIVVVNDGSTDDTSEVARTLIRRNPSHRLRLIEKQNGGPSDARNAGIRFAKGDYILPLDGDDRIAPEFLAKTVALLEQCPEIGIAYTDWVYFGDVNAKRNALDYDFTRLCQKENLFTCTALYRRQAWEAAGGYNLNMTRGVEDWDFWIACGKRGFKGQRIPEPLFFYRAKEGGRNHAALPHLPAMFARIVLNHPELYSTNVVENARRTLATADVPPPKPSSPGVEWLPAQAPAGDFASLVTTAERSLREGRTGEAAKLLEQALAIAPNPECAARAKEILQMMQSSESAAQPALAGGDEADFFAADEVANIERIVAAYGENPGEASTREEIEALQQGLMKFLVTTPADELERRWKGNFARVFRLLAASGLASEPPSEASESQRAVLDEALEASEKSPGGFDFRPLLARMLRVPAHRGSLAFAPEKVPAWALDDYLGYLLHAPDVFVTPGEADEYHAHMLGCLRVIAQRVRTAPTEPLTRKAAAAVVKAKAIPLYFTSANTREAAEKRAAIIEYVLRQKGAAIDCVLPKRPVCGRKIRVGFLNMHFGAQTETHIALPMLRLDRGKFDVQLFAVARNPGPVEDYALSLADGFTLLPAALDQRVTAIREAALDVVIVGTNITAVVNDVALIAAHRLAPVQLVSYCSPVSTGFRHIDGYLTGTLNGAPGLQAHFSETLRYCDGAPGCFDYTVEKAGSRTFDRASLGIAPDEIVFVNAGACYKTLPEMQETWARILKAVPNSRLLLLPFNPNWSRAFPAKQFERTLVAACERHGVDHRRLMLAGSLPSRADVKALERIADVYLDTYPFSGSISVVDPLELGMPVVVREGATHRGRMATALLREIGVTDLITHSEDEYVALAATLATDARRRQDVSERIRSAMALGPKFLDPAAFAQDLGGLIESLVTGTGRPVAAEAVA